MFILVFTLLLIAVVLAWRGKRRPAIMVYIFTIVLGILMFCHHMTDKLMIQL